MDGSDTPEEFSEWEEAAEYAMEEARLQGCRSELALRQRRSGGGPVGSNKGPAVAAAAVWRRSGRGGSSSGDGRGRGNNDEKKRYPLSSRYHVENKENRD